MVEDAETEARRLGEPLRAEYAAGSRDFAHRTIAGVRIEEADFSGCDFSGTCFVDCVFARVVFDDSRFTHARFERCNVAQCRFHRADLAHAVLGPAWFRGSDFYLASLRHANFDGCAAEDTYLGQADLSEADLGGGRFGGAWFLFTRLHNATLVGADLEGASVRGINLVGRDTLAKNAALLRKTMGESRRIREMLANLTPTVRDIAMSHARAALPAGVEPAALEDIPAFLQLLEKQFEPLRRFLLASGCEPDEVARMTDAADQTRSDYPRVFLSYSSADEAFAAQLHASLTAFGVDAWFAPENMRGGRKIHEQLEAAIAERDKIILVLSADSLKSRWVASEVQWAAAREIESGEQILFPIRIVAFEAVRQWTLFDADLGQDVAKYVRQYFVPDFTAWQDGEALARQTERFLRDLRHGTH